MTPRVAAVRLVLALGVAAMALAGLYIGGADDAAAQGRAARAVGAPADSVSGRWYLVCPSPGSEPTRRFRGRFRLYFPADGRFTGTLTGEVNVGIAGTIDKAGVMTGTGMTGDTVVTWKGKVVKTVRRKPREAQGDFNVRRQNTGGCLHGVWGTPGIDPVFR